MRFVKVVVKNFQAIESAEVDLGRGLNIIFGANDVGKSTLASAIRAALLVPPSSSEANRYRPWFVDAVPEVTLTFTDDDNRFWRVRKCFGVASGQTTADLHYSKDGMSFATDCRGREVEEQLRKVIGWGIPSPGGKGAPRRLPTSFLAHVLLAEQADVDKILGQSTEEDGTTAGRERLRKALAGLAEDPWFKRVLSETQKRVDALFTPTGQRKRGRGSPFAVAADDVRRRADKVDALKKAVSDSRAIEDHVRVAREECDGAREAVDESAAALASVRQQHARAAARARAEANLSEAKSALDALERQAKEVDERAGAVKELETSVKTNETRAAEARSAVESAEAGVRGAEEALRAATSEDGAQQRELTRARLAEERADLGTKAGRAEKRRDDIEAVEKALATAATAAKAKADAERAVAQADAGEEGARVALAQAEQDLELARGILAYGCWHAADVAAKQAAEATHRADVARAQADAKEGAAKEAEGRASDIAADANLRKEGLPDEALVKRLEALAQQIAVAEAALGGGLSLTLRGTGKVPVQVTIDGTEVIGGPAVDGRLVLEAERAALLRVGDLLDIEVVAGAAEKRHALQALQERWTAEAQPVLERAGQRTISEIRERLTDVAALETNAATLRIEAKQLRTEVEAARQSASMLGQRAEELVRQGGEAEELKSRFASLDAQVLAAGFAKLGATWREQTERLIAAKEKAAKIARESGEKQTRGAELSKYQLGEAEKSAATAVAEAARLHAGLGFESPSEQRPSATILGDALASARAELTALESRRAAIDEELRALEQEASNAVNAAKVAVEDAKTRRDRAREHETHAAKAFQESQKAFHSACGELEALRKALENADRSGAENRATRALQEFEAYANDPIVTSEEVAAAEQREAETKARLEQLRAQLHQAEGALSKVGGAGIREELAREEEAYALAKEHQRELEIDADAWRLLRETLDVVEKEGSTHLGRALAAPVSARIVELTQGRYDGLRLNQHLKAERVDVPLVTTDESLLDALSVGTRDQVATLLRLTVAEQLKSAIVLDDHLVNTDPERLLWFRNLLRESAVNTQIIVLTCRPHDYVAANECPDEGTTRDLAGGMVRTIDVARAIRRFDTKAAAPVSSAKESTRPQAPR